jgi:HD-like signal output (HDOD) protein
MSRPGRRPRFIIEARRPDATDQNPAYNPPVHQQHPRTAPEDGEMSDRADRERLLAARVDALADKPDFPAFSQQIEETLRVLGEQEVSAQQLAELVLRNYSLTLKVLRAANSFNFNRGGVPIFSVAQAIFRLGIARVRALVGGLLYFEHFHAKTGPVKELVLLSLVSANHAAGAATRVGSPPEEAYLAGMLRNLGEVLLACYFPDDYQRVVARALQTQGSGTEVCERELGFTYEDLGRAMIARWGMPTTVAATITTELPDTPRTAPRLLVVTALGHGLTTALYRGDARDARARLTLLVQKLGQPLGLSLEAVKAIADAAAADARRSFTRLNARPRDLAILDRSRAAFAPGAGSAPGAEATAGPAPDPAPAAEPVSGAAASGTGGFSASPTALFQQLTSEVDHMLDTRAGSDLHAVLLMVLEAVQRGGGFDRVVFALVTPDKQHVQGRLAIGSRSEPLKGLFSFPLSMQGGPIGVALARQQELILRADWELRPDEASLLAHFGARLIGLLPLVISGTLVGCLYFDRIASVESPSPDVEAGLRKLRDRAVSVLSRRR